jgi:hypothetical protein
MKHLMVPDLEHSDDEELVYRCANCGAENPDPDADCLVVAE